MEEINLKIKELKECLEELNIEGIQLPLPPDMVEEIEACVNKTREWLPPPSEKCEEYIYAVDSIKDKVINLYQIINKLQDLFYEKEM